MRRRVFAWVLLVGFVFIMVNFFLYFLNIHLSELHSLIMKLSAVAYFIILLILLAFKIRKDMQDRNQKDLNNRLDIERDDSDKKGSDEGSNKINE